MDKNKEQVNIKDALLLIKSYTLDELQQKIEQFLIKIIKEILFLLCIAILILPTPISIVVDLGNQIEELVINFQKFLLEKGSTFVNWLDKIEKGINDAR